MGIFPKYLCILNSAFFCYFSKSKSKSYLNKKIKNLNENGFLIKQKIKLSAKHEEDMKKPLIKINEDPGAYRKMFSGPAV